MADPFTASMAAAGTLVAGQTFSNIQAIRGEVEIKQAIAERNAKVEKIAGREAFRRRMDEAIQLKKRAKSVRARNIARGAPLSVLEENAAIAELESSKIIRQGVIEEQRHKQRADLDLLGGKIAKATEGKRIFGEASRGVAGLANLARASI